MFCRSFASAPSRIVLDIDDTDDRVHSQQQLALLNAHYDGNCSQPSKIFEPGSGKPVLALIRPCKRRLGGGRTHHAPCHPSHPQALAEGCDPRAGGSLYCGQELLALMEDTHCDYLRSMWRGATLEAIRRALVKVRIEELKSRIKIAFPASFPHRAM